MKKILLFLLCINIFIPYVHASVDTAYEYVLMDIDSGRILASKNMNSPKLIASITKIMTAIIVIENANLDRIITVGDEVLSMYGSNIYIEVGEEISVKDLLYGLILRSGNDAAITLAKNTAGIDNFVTLMNKKAKEIGMSNTIFNNPHGLDEDTQNYSTAYDMALLSSYAYKNEIFKEISGCKKWSTQTNKKTYIWFNRNKMLNLYSYATGGKTGYTPKAGRTLVTTASKNNLNLTIVTLNDDNQYDTHKYLYEKNFSKYDNYLLIDKDNFDVDDYFYKGKVYVKESFTYPLTEKEKDNTKTIINIYKLDNYENDDIVGDVTVILNDEEIYKENIYVKKEETRKEGLFSKIIKFFKSILTF